MSQHLVSDGGYSMIFKQKLGAKSSLSGGLATGKVRSVASGKRVVTVPSHKKDLCRLDTLLKLLRIKTSQ